MQNHELSVSLEDFTHFLRNRLAHPLPGFDAQRKMAPRFERGTYRSFTAPDTAKQSAVLVLLTQKEETPHVVLTLRSSELRNHKGQISFPGGRRDGNESAIQTALRETHEEIGVAAHHIDVLGELSTLYTPPSNSNIVPIVGTVTQLPATVVNPQEVEEVFTVSLNTLSNPEFYEEEDWDLQQTAMRVPFWRVHNSVPLWGATAIIISELLHLWQECIDMHHK